MSTSLVEQSGARGYLDIAAALRGQVASGGLRAGEQLPAISSLAGRFRATPITVRRALRHLEEAGLVRVEHGVGTFVADWAREHELLPSFSAELGGRDLVLKTVVVDRRPRVTHPAAAVALHKSPEAQLALLVRVRWVGGRPIASQRSYLAPELAELVMEFGEGSALYERLREETGRLPLAAEETLRSVPLPKKAAKALEVPRDTPGWFSARLTRDAAGEPLLYDEAWLPGDRVELRLNRRAGQSTATLALIETPEAAPASEDQ